MAAAYSEAGALSGTITRTWHFGEEAQRHTVQLRHQSVSGYRYVIVDGIEVANSEGTSSLLFQSDQGDAIVLEIKEAAEEEDAVHRQFDDSDDEEEEEEGDASAKAAAGGAASSGTTHMLIIRIKPTSDGIAYQYACSYNGEPLAETNSLAPRAGAASATFKVTIPVSDVAEEEGGGKVAWYRVDCERVSDKHSTSVCRRFSEFFDLNTDVTSAFVGSAVADRLPIFPSRGFKLFGLTIVDHYSKSFVEGRRSSLAGYMQELANAPTVDTNPEFLRFVDMTDQFRKLDIKVLMSGDAAETADLLGDEVFSEDVSRPGEVSVSFEAGSLGLSLRAVAEGEGSATQRVEAPAVVLGFTGTNGQAEESKIIAKGDFVSRVGGISVMPGCYADIIHVLKTAPRPIIVHFIKSSFLPHIDVDLTPTWKTATPREPTTHLVTLTLPTQLSGPYAFHITLPPPAQKIAADHSDVPTIGITADEVEAFDRLFIDAGAHRDRLPTEVNAAEMQRALLLAQSARVSFSAEDGSELFAVLAFVPDTNGTQLALYTDATLTAPVETSPTIVPTIDFELHPMPPSASAAGNVLSLPTVTGAVALTLQASEGEGAEAGWTASAWAKGLLATSSHLALSAAGAAAAVEDGDDDSVSGSKSAALSSNPLRLDGGGRGAGARQESGAAWFRRTGLGVDELRVMWGLACGGKASRALERAHFFLALKLVAAAQRTKEGLGEEAIAGLAPEDTISYSRVIALQKDGASAGWPLVLGVFEGGEFVSTGADAAAAVGAGSSSGAGASASAGGADATAAAAAVGGADAAAMFARPSASRGRDSSAGESEASGFM